MFYVRPKDTVDLLNALNMLGTYNVRFQVWTDDPTETPEAAKLTLLVDNEIESGEDDLGLAEIAFQGNFHQDNNGLCEMCKEEFIEEADMIEGIDKSLIPKVADQQPWCGHMTFTRLIRPAF